MVSKMANKEGMVSKKDFMDMMGKKFDEMDKDKKSMLSKDDVVRIFGDKHWVEFGLAGGITRPRLQRKSARPAGAGRKLRGWRDAFLSQPLVGYAPTVATRPRRCGRRCSRESRHWSASPGL
jgi:hypothetical protein